MKAWKKQGRKRRQLAGHGAQRKSRTLKQRRARAEHWLRTNRAGVIKRKTKVLPRGSQE